MMKMRIQNIRAGSTCQRGFALISALILMVVTIMAAAWQNQQMFDKAQITKAETQGELLNTQLNNAMGTYVTTYYNQLVNNLAIPGVTNIYAPTIAELKTLGVLDVTFSTTNMYGGGYGLSASRVPAGCTPPDCDVSSLVWLASAITNASGSTDMSYAAAAAARIGANGAFSTLGAPGTLSGIGGAWSAANPVTGTPAGIVAARNGYGSQGFSQFLRRDGSLPMTGNLDVGGQAINNGSLLQLSSAQTVGASCTTGQIGRDSTGQVLACVSGTWTVAGAGKWKDPVANFASLPVCNAASAWETRIVQTPTVGAGPRAYTCDGTSWKPLAVDDSGNLTVIGTVTLGKAIVNDVVTEGTACSPNGLVARDANGLLLSCQSGVWRRLWGIRQTVRINSACVADEKLTAGGFACSGTGYAKWAYPDLASKTWVVDCYGGTTTVYNVCTQD